MKNEVLALLGLILVVSLASAVIVNFPTLTPTASGSSPVITSVLVDGYSYTDSSATVPFDVQSSSSLEIDFTPDSGMRSYMMEFWKSDPTGKACLSSADCAVLETGAFQAAYTQPISSKNQVNDTQLITDKAALSGTGAVPLTQFVSSNDFWVTVDTCSSSSDVLKCSQFNRSNTFRFSKSAVKQQGRCSSIKQCLALVDGKLMGQVFKVSYPAPQ